LTPPVTAALPPAPAGITRSNPGGHRGVTQNESETHWHPAGTVWTPHDLSEARWLDLGGIPVSSRATNFVNDLTSMVAAGETRGNRRRAQGHAKLTRAVGAITAGLLKHWRRSEPTISFRTLEPAEFTGALVAHRQFKAAMDGLVALRLVGKAASVRFGTDWGDGTTFQGLAARFRPTDDLLDLAAAHGLLPGTLPGDFRSEFSTVAPKVRQLVELRPLKEPRRGKSGSKPRAELAVPPSDAGRLNDLRAEVAAANAFAERFIVEPCLPPRWKRVFTASLALHGRWYSVGSDGAYQRMSEDERLAIRIGGEPVVEIDIRASHLTIMNALCGLPAILGDPYEIAGVDRPVIKAWITGTLGKGSPVVRWASTVAPSVAATDARAVGVAVLTRYPFLKKPSARADHLAPIGLPRRLLTHYLMGLESAALTDAMTSLRSQGVLALPTHDGLIVPASAEVIASEAMLVAFRKVTGADVQLTVGRLENGRGR
jgi:hypothetical protein